MRHLSVLSRCVLALTLCLVSWMVSAQLAPMPQRALSWLASQVQDAVLQDESRSAATGPQARSEAVSTLQALSTLPQRMADSVFGLAADDTEYLARRVIAGQAVGRESGAEFLLRSRQGKRSPSMSVRLSSGGAGAGYMVIDPDTGAGGYLIEGGSNGGALVTVIPPQNQRSEK